jgi:hypothetical protein
MHPRRGMLCVVGAAALAAAALSSVTHAAGKVERIGAFTGAAPDWIKPKLDPQGYRVALSDGTVVGDVWFRKDLSGLKLGTFVGVMTFPVPTTDFRTQDIKPGTYTLRYAEMPSDGDHLGAAPTSTFLLLSPVAMDTRPVDDLTFKEVTKMSARTNGSNHPSPLNLADVSAQKEFPAVGTNQYGHEVFFVKLKTASGAEVPIGLVVKGRTEHEV